MPSDGGDLDDVAGELYGLPPSEFTAARDARAAAARKAGDRELAAELKKLRRPTVGAWLTNQLVRRRGDQVATLLRLGAALRDAQAQLAGEDLRRLTQQGQQVVAALGREARQFAADAGQPAGDSAVREVEETLHAALADPSASEKVAAGRLTSALSYAGFGTLEPAVSGPAAPRAGRRADEDRDGRAAVRALHAELAGARRDAADRKRLLEKARQRHEQLDRRVRELSAELERLDAEAAEAGAAVRDAEDAVQAADRRLARAQAAIDRHQSHS